MGYRTDTPRQIRAAVQANRWEVAEFTYHAGSQSVSVIYTPGFFDGAATQWGATLTHHRAAAPYMDVQPSARRKVSEHLLDTAYQILLDDGILPPGGTVES